MLATEVRKYVKTAAMEATGMVGESRLFLLDYLLRLLQMLALLAVWRMILAGKGTVSGMTLSSVLTYTLIAEVCSDLLSCRTGLESAWFNGSITTRYLRPFGLFGQFASEMFGRALVGLALFSLPLLLLAPLLGVDPRPASLLSGALFGVSLCLAVWVGLAIEYLFIGLGVLAQMHPYIINNIRSSLGALVSGAVIPLALLPWGLGRICAWLPFAAQASAPLRIYTGTGSIALLLGSQCLWGLLLWPLAGRLWWINRERMATYGG